jgi:hypothetical protein
MFIFSCLPIQLLSYGRVFPFPVVWQATIDWSFSVDAERVDYPPGRTETTTLVGSGSGNITIDCDPHRANRPGIANVTPERFIVTRRMRASAERFQDMRRFQLYCDRSAIAGDYSVTQTVEKVYDDPNTPPETTTETEASDAVIAPIWLIIDPETVVVQDISVLSTTTDQSPASSWMAPDDWTFARSALWEPQTFTATKTPVQMGYQTGEGWEQSITITLTKWSDQPGL